MGLFGDLLGAALGSAASSISNTVGDYYEYTSSGQYHEDKARGSNDASDMSDRALYNEMKNKNRSAGERIAYSEELKKRGH